MIARILAVAALGLGSITHSAPAAEEGVLSGLRAGHPRLFFLREDESRLRKLMEEDPLAKEWHRRLRDQATKMLAEKPVEYVLIGPRLLDKSRKAFNRISLLAALYRLDGDKQFAERARQELLAVCAFPDWHPPHFLDTAEMANAAGVGYDWLFDQLSVEDRSIIRAAIVEKGLKPGLAVLEKHLAWSANHNNWNQVCNGGLTVGALAIADEEPAIAGRLVDESRKSIPLAIASYGPDGGWEEGPGYWGYATNFTAYYLAALDSALGTDFGLKKTPGLAQAGFFRLQTIGPLERTFNFADAHEEPGTVPAMFWLARQFNEPVFAANERSLAKAHPEIFDLIWYTPEGNEKQLESLPLDAIFRRVNVACFRGAWGDPKALFVGFKGGDNQAGHSHLDLGTFVLDADGQRWGVDLGPDDYNLPGYFGKNRFTYYRLRTEGHNTLTIDDQNQEITAKAPLVAFATNEHRSYAVADLSAAYAKKTESSFRGIALLDRKRVLVEDEVHARGTVNITWNFHTSAQIEIEPAGQAAWLKQKDAALHARILSPPDARFELVSANPPLPQKQQPDVHNLVIHLPERSGETRIVVLFSPGAGDEAAPAIEPIEKWIADARVR